MNWINIEYQTPFCEGRYIVAKTNPLTKKINVCVEQWVELLSVKHENENMVIERNWKFLNTTGPLDLVTHWAKIPTFWRSENHTNLKIKKNIMDDL